MMDDHIPHPTYQVQCSGHEELRDIAITTRAEVRILSGQMSQIATAIEDLKADKNQRIGSEKNSHRTAAIIAGIISSAGVVVGLILTVWGKN